MNGQAQWAIFVIVPFHSCPMIIPGATAEVLVLCSSLSVQNIQPLDSIVEFHSEQKQRCVL